MEELKSLSDLPDLTPDFRRRVEDFRGQADEYVKEYPEKSVALAVAGGFVLSQLPIFFIFVLILRAVLFALKPALLILGGIKLVEEVKTRWSV